MALAEATVNKDDIAALRKTLEGFSERRFNATLAMALTDTVIAIKDEEVREMKDVFDRPTPWTLNSQYVKRATAETLYAETGVADNPFKGRSATYYLQYHVWGGLRSQKAFERRLVSGGAMRNDQRSVPGKFARLDAFGNMEKGQLNQIFSHLRIEQAAGAKSTLPKLLKTDTDKERKHKISRINSSYKRAGGQYVAFPNGRGRLIPGVYLIRRSGLGTASPKPVLIFVSKAAYEAGRFDYFYVAERTAERVLPAKVAKSVDKMLEHWLRKYTGAK